ncbi:MAG: class I SAM-dependent methyltransferase [Solirubrobacterales bacterium]
MESSQRNRPPARIRVMGRILNDALVRVPWLWPVLRNPMRSFFERSAPGWDERTGAGSPDHLAALSAAALAVAHRPERVLDVGTGTGEGALLLAREFPRASVRGIDISEEMIRSAQAKIGLDPEGRVAFRVADAASLPYGEDSFDLVALLNMPPFFGEIARVLRPAGSVIVAASWGADTPFFTPVSVLERGFARREIDAVSKGEVQYGTYWVGRRRLT